jgi:hypothetical protein
LVVTDNLLTVLTWNLERRAVFMARGKTFQRGRRFTGRGATDAHMYRKASLGFNNILNTYW